jgi:carboxyl-terminal processing protease
LRFTTAKYYTPSKKVINGNGVDPNIRVTMTPEQERQLFVSRSNAPASAAEDKDFIRKRDPQMLRAIDALKGVMIYAQLNTGKVESIKK